MKLTPEQLKANIDAMQKQGASDTDIQGYLDSLKNSVDTVDPVKEHVGMFQGILQGAAHPFLKVAASVRALGDTSESIYKDLTGQDSSQLDASLEEGRQKGYDYGYLGNVRPFGANLKSGEWAGPKELMEAAGTGAEIASYFTPLKIPAGGGFFKNIFNLKSFATAAPFAAPFALGKALQAGGEGKGVGDALAEGAGAYVGSVFGLNLMKGGGALLGNFGARLMKNGVIKASAEKLGDLADVIMNSVPPEVRTKIGDSLGWNSRLYKKEFDTAHKKLIDATIDEFTKPVPNGDEAFQGYRQSLNKYITSQYNKKATDFQDVFSSPHTVTEYSATKAAIDKAKADVNTLVKSGLYDSGQNLQNYIGKVEGLLGSGYNKPQTLKIVDALYSAADGYIGKSNAEDALIRDISHALLDDATLSVSKGAPELLSRWNQARTFAQDISTNVNSEFASKLKNAPKLNNFVDSLMTSNGPSREEIAAFNKAFNESERQEISQAVFNSVISKAKVARTPAEGAEIIDKTLKNLEQYGDDNIIDAAHAAQLENLRDLMGSNFKDFLFNIEGQAGEEATKVAQQNIEKTLTEDMVKLADSGRYSELGDRISKITGTEEVQAVLKLVGDDPELQKGVGQEIMRGILSKNKSIFVGENGKYDFSGFFKDLDKIGGPNKDEIFNSLFTPEQKGYLDYLFKLREEVGSMENLKGENLLKFAHGTTGLLYAFTGRVVPATYHLSQIMKVSSRNKIPFAQLRDLSEELSSEGRVKDGLWKKFGDVLHSGPAVKAGASAGGQKGGPTFEAFVKAAEQLFGRPLDERDMKELESVYNER